MMTPANLSPALVADLRALTPVALDAVLADFDDHERQRVRLAVEQMLPPPHQHSPWMASLLDDAMVVSGGGAGQLTRATAEALLRARGRWVPHVSTLPQPGPSLLDSLKGALPTRRPKHP